MRLCHLLSCRRGWPESANTWEPYENLASVPDVVDAFEQRFLSFFVVCICDFLVIFTKSVYFDYLEEWHPAEVKRLGNARANLEAPVRPRGTSLLQL